MSNKDLENENASQEIGKEARGSFSKRRMLFGILTHSLTFLGGVFCACLWLKFVTVYRYEMEEGMMFFRGPKMLIVMTSFFFLMGMGMVYGLRHIITWLRECRTY